MAIILEKTMLDLSLDVRRAAAGEPPCAPFPDLRSGEAKPERVATTRFGVLEADPDLILNFPEGLIGFEGCRRFIVVRHQDKSAFRWLQSLDEAHVAFPILEPAEFCAHYTPTISNADAALLEINDQSAILLFTIVTVPPRSPRDMTANLLGPLVINGVTRRGKQVIVQDEGYTTRHKITDELTRREAQQANQKIAVVNGAFSPGPSSAAANQAA